MQNYVLALLWALGAYITYRALTSFLRERRYAIEAARLGCKPPPLQPNRWLYGIDRVWEGLQADRAMDFTNLLVRRYAAMNNKTHHYHIFGMTGIATADPKNVQAVLATQFHDFSLGVLRRDVFLPLLGNGIFTLDGKGWEHSRAMMRPQFARDQVSDLELEENHVQNMMRALPVDANGWTAEVDLQVLFFRLTLDSACEFLFGESVDSQLAALPSNVGVPPKGGLRRDEKVFAAAFDLGQKYLATRARFMDKYWLVNNAEFRRTCKTVHDFIDYFVKLALNKEFKEKEMEKGNIVRKDRYVFLDALVRETRDPIELRSQLLNILLAGRDTTASLLGWTFFILVRHPEAYAKLREVVLNDFGTYTNSAELTFSSLKSCQYLQHVINETLRLYPVVPLNSRRAVRDTTLPRGGGPDGMSKIFVKKGQQVDYSVHVMHHLKELWGEDADEFKPERWIGRKPGWEYLPFNGGPRICLGRKSSYHHEREMVRMVVKVDMLMILKEQFSLTEASYVIVRMLQRFEAIENCETETVVKHNLTLTSCSGTGVKVRLREAKQ